MMPAAGSYLKTATSGEAGGCEAASPAPARRGGAAAVATMSVMNPLGLAGSERRAGRRYEVSLRTGEVLAPLYDCLTARTAREGFKALDAAPVDAVVTDLRLPGMSGIEFLGS